MESSSIVVIAFLCLFGAFVNARSDSTKNRSLSRNLWILFATFGPALLSAFLLEWWAFFIVLATTFILAGVFRRLIQRPTVGSNVLEYAKRIATISESFYTSISKKSSSKVKRSDVLLDMSSYCLYLTFRELINTKHSADTCKQIIGQLTKHISFYVENDVSFGNIYMSQFVAFTEKLDIKSKPSEAKAKIVKHFNTDYNLDEMTSASVRVFVDKLDSLLRIEDFVKIVN